MICRLSAWEVFIPDGDEAQQWAEDELSKPEYQQAKPNWFDQLVRDVVDGIIGLFNGDGTGSVAPIALTIIAIVLIAAIVVALIIWDDRAPRGPFADAPTCSANVMIARPRSCVRTRIELRRPVIRAPRWSCVSARSHGACWSVI